jgi:hypothetical protein
MALGTLFATTTLVVFLVGFLATFLLGCGVPASEGSVDTRPPEEALRSALQKPQGLDRVRDYVRALSNLDPDTARRLADQFTDTDKKADEKVPAYELRLFYTTWAEVDADGALNYILELPEEAPFRNNVASSVVRSVTAVDPARARVWVRTLPETESEEFRVSLAIALVEGWPAATAGFQGVSEVVEQLPVGFARQRAAHALAADVMAAGQIEEAIEWAESIPLSASGKLRALIFRKIAETASPAQFQPVSDWLDGHRDQREGQAGLRVLARSWATKDPEAALRWALAQPDDRGRFLSLKFAFQQYYDTDRERAQSWLNAQPDSPALDTPRLAFGLAHVHIDPAQAAETARKIHDEKNRDETLAKIVGLWLSQDRASAREWIGTSGLPQSYWLGILRPNRASAPAPNETGAGGS